MMVCIIAQPRIQYFILYFLRCISIYHILHTLHSISLTPRVLMKRFISTTTFIELLCLYLVAMSNHTKMVVTNIGNRHISQLSLSSIVLQHSAKSLSSIIRDTIIFLLLYYQETNEDGIISCITSQLLSTVNVCKDMHTADKDTTFISKLLKPNA